MDRIGAAGGSPTGTLANGHLGGVDQNLSIGQEGTQVPALFLNAIQEELLAILTAAGVTPDINNWGQVLNCIIGINAPKIQVFNTAGTYTATMPPNKVSALVIVVGAGGRGGAGNSGAGAGGQGGGAAIKMATFYPGATFTVVVGAGGTSGTPDGGSSAACGMTALGGVHGGIGVAGGISPNTTVTGFATGGLLNFIGGVAPNGSAEDTLWIGTGGGSSLMGYGPPNTLGGSGYGFAGANAWMPGAGGAGGTYTNNGGNGADGIVIFIG